MPRRETLESTTHAQAPADALASAVRRLRSAVDAARERALALDRPVLAWAAARVPLPEPLDLFERSAAVARNRILWMRGEDRVSLVGVGAAWTFTAEGRERFALAENAWRSILKEAIGEEAIGDRDTEMPEAGLHQADAPGRGLVAFFGFSFAPDRPTAPDITSAKDPSARRDRSVLPQWDGYPAGLLVIPRVLVSRIGDESRLTLALVVDPRGSPLGLDHLNNPHERYEQLLTCLFRERRAGAGASKGSSGSADAEREDEFPPAEAWKASVHDTARAVRNGDLRKAVLARGLRIRGTRFDSAAALRRLGVGYPGCTVFAVARGDRCFLGATPERLVRVRNGEVTAAAIAGSAPRGRTQEDDRRLGETLLASPKDRVEHAIVVDAVRDALAGVCADVSIDNSPRLLTVRNAHHLYTPVRAALRDRRTVLALTDRLHPTPAVGGMPRGEALAWIDRHEGWDRGWYAGPIGWMDRTGEGEAAVAIRSALLDPTEAFLFAGCGIVAGSDPGQEYEESGLKLEPVLSALRGAAGDDAWAWGEGT